MRVVMLVAGVVSALMLVRAEPQGTAGQNAAPVFRTDTQYVPVNAIVTDSRDRVVTGLTKDDFVITANGREQKIADFSFVSIPVGERVVDLDADHLMLAFVGDEEKVAFLMSDPLGVRDTAQRDGSQQFSLGRQFGNLRRLVDYRE